MTKEELKQLDDQGLAAWNTHDSEAFVKLLADDFVWYDWAVPQPLRDKDSAKALFNSWMEAFPDLHTKLVSQVIGEDAVAGELILEGTNSGPLAVGDQMAPPTNRHVSLHGSYMARVRDGKITEFRTHPDVAGMLTQLGMMPNTVH